MTTILSEILMLDYKKKWIGIIFKSIDFWLSVGKVSTHISGFRTTNDFLLVRSHYDTKTTRAQYLKHITFFKNLRYPLLADRFFKPFPRPSSLTA